MTCARCSTPIGKRHVRRYRARLARAGLAGAQLPPLCELHERLLWSVVAGRLTPRPRQACVEQISESAHVDSEIPTQREPRPQQPDHASDVQLGGKANVGDVVLNGKRVRLRVLHPRPVPVGFTFVVEPGRSPKTRGDCPPIAADGKRWCGFVRCRMHNWRVDGADRPGRRWTDHDHRPHVISMRAPTCCALDVLDARNGLPMTHAEVGEALGITERQVRRVFNRARRSSSELADAERLLEEMVNR